MSSLVEFFTENLSPKQNLYEAIRALAFKEGEIEEISKKFGYKSSSLKTLISEVLSGKKVLFSEDRKGPQARRTNNDTCKMIINLRRNEQLNSEEIAVKLNLKGIEISSRTIERILKDFGFPKLHRRTNKQRGLTKKETFIPLKAEKLNFKELKCFKADCQIAGIFFFLPYILETGILEIVKECNLPESSVIRNIQAALSMLLLKLIGSERLSHIDKYDHDVGFGIFAGLGVLPKPTYMCNYSCRTEANMLLEFQKKAIKKLMELYPDLYCGETINLDFHSIPHYGNESSMEKVWCGAKGKSLKGANSFFAQSANTGNLLYTRADIKRAESSEEIKKFVDYWIELKGVINETLVFDSRLTRYDILHDLDRENVKFITLRTRSEKLIKETLLIPDEKWQKEYLPIPKRKHKRVSVYETTTVLVKKEKPFRQLIIKDHGRAEPTFIVTNNWDLKITDILIIYAKRWHIENKISELVNFFNVNSLSSPIMIRIHFDILWTIIADTLYKLFMQDLRRFEVSTSAKIFRKFIDMPGRIFYDQKSFILKIRKRATTPVLMGVKKLKEPIIIPWLNNLPLKIVWTP